MGNIFTTSNQSEKKKNANNQSSVIAARSSLIRNYREVEYSHGHSLNTSNDNYIPRTVDRIIYARLPAKTADRTSSVRSVNRDELYRHQANDEILQRTRTNINVKLSADHINAQRAQALTCRQVSETSQNFSNMTIDENNYGGGHRSSELERDCSRTNDQKNVSISSRNKSHETPAKSTNLTLSQKNFLEYIKKEVSLRHAYAYGRKDTANDFYQTSGICPVCQLNFISKLSLQAHIKLHKLNLIPCPSSAYECSSSVKLTYMLEPNNAVVKFKLENCQLSETTINQIFMFDANNSVELIEKERFPMPIIPLQFISFEIQRSIFLEAPHSYQIFINFERNGQYFIERYDFVINKPIPKLLIFPDFFVFYEKTKEERKNELKCKPLPLYYPSKAMRNIVDANFKLKSGMTSNEISLLETLRNFGSLNKYGRLNPQNYVRMLTYLIEMEDIFCEKMMREFDKRDETLHFRGGYYVLPVENLSEHRPSLLPYDDVVVSLETTSNSRVRNKNKVRGCIMRCEKDYAVLKLDKDIDCKLKYRIHFEMNRSNFRLERRAIEIIGEEKLSKFLFPQTIPQKMDDKHLSLQWFNKNIVTNPEQKQAVTNIVLGRAHPSPYIIFGPPGTGKTMTIVEAITQLYTVLPSSRILITTGSNSACNEITSRLLNFVPGKDMLRMFSNSQEQAMDKIGDDIINVSNLKSGKHSFPVIGVIKKYRIILSTVSIAGKLVQASIDPQHFTHVFIDECGSITETTALIPIAGMITTSEQFYGNVIIAGDPLQLGPIINSAMAEKLGLETSLLDRLMNLPIYGKHPITNRYNERVITKLLQNYRSHPAILELPNEMFYRGELKAMASKDNVNWALNWKFLPNPDIPIILNAVNGNMQKDNNSPSWYNMKEVDRVKFYLGQLMAKKINGKLIGESDIGIVSPYRKQCQKIREYISKRGWDNIEVASVEAFQGREKSIIIISTVRSNTKSLGFLTNEKRLNVALTRAKALMVVVGDPKLLKTDPNWGRFIEYCVTNRCCHGEIIND